MPVYGTNTPTLLTAGDDYLVWSAETPSAGSSSHAAYLKRDAFMPTCLSAEILFAADPGAFAIDLQVADTNAEQYYVTKASLTTGLNGTFCGRIEATNVVAQFVRLKLVSRTNAVAVTAKLF